MASGYPAIYAEEKSAIPPILEPIVRVYCTYTVHNGVRDEIRVTSYSYIFDVNRTRNFLESSASRCCGWREREGGRGREREASVRQR